MPSSLPLLRQCGAFLAIAALVTLPALGEDGPPVDTAHILDQLKLMKDLQVQQVKKTKRTALQQIQAAANDPGKAMEMWVAAVQATQFDGVSKEGTALRDWRASEGEALKEKECQAALHLYFSWLTLTLERASGSTMKELLPAVVGYTKEANADQLAMEGFDETVKREKEMEASHKHGNPRRNNDELVKRTHDQIMRGAVTGSMVVQWLRITDILNDAGAAKSKPAEPGQPAPPTWEYTPGNIDAIFQKIILPELRVEKDPRIVEYWDMKLKQEADAATKAKLAFEADKFNQVRRPQLLWSRAQDVLVIGQRNRAVAEMFKLIQTYPTHPDAANWMTSLEQTLAPAAPVPPAPVSAAVPSVAPSVPAVPVPVLPIVPSNGPAVPVPISGLPSAYPPTAGSGAPVLSGS